MLLGFLNPHRLQTRIVGTFLGLLLLICLISVLVVPTLRKRLNQQFMLGARYKF